MIRHFPIVTAVAVVLALAHALSAAPPAKGLALPCSVVEVHDGDTATVDVVVRVNVRFVKGRVGCWAPELRDLGGPASRDNIKWATNKQATLFVPIGESADNLADLFTLGRVLGEIWVNGKSESLSEYQIRTAHASTQKGGKLGE